MSVLHCILVAHHASSFSAFSTIFDFWLCCKSKASEVVYPTAHSGECRSRGEVACSPEKHVARVDVSVALHPGSASRELVLSHFAHFFTFGCAHVKNVGNSFPECALERAPFQRRSGLFARKARCSRRCRYCTSSRERITRARSQPFRPFLTFGRDASQNNVGSGLPECALERPPFQRRSGLFAR